MESLDRRGFLAGLFGVAVAASAKPVLAASTSPCAILGDLSASLRIGDALTIAGVYAPGGALKTFRVTHVGPERTGLEAI